jgi:hypothetical protein
MKWLPKIALAASLAAAGLAVPAAGQVGSSGAQRGGETQEEKDARKGGVESSGQGKEEKPADGKAGQSKNADPKGSAARQGEARGANQGAENAGEPAAGGPRPLSREEATEFLRRMAQEENLYRGHLARLARLRELSQEANDEARLAEVEALLAKENARHERVIAQMERHVGPEMFRKGQQKLKDHIQKRRAEAASGAGKEGDAGKNADKERNADKDKEKPNTERKDDGARGQGENEQGSGRDGGAQRGGGE